MALSRSLASKLSQWRQKFLISYVNLFPPTFVELSKLTPPSSTSAPLPLLLHLMLLLPAAVLSWLLFYEFAKIHMKSSENICMPCICICICIVSVWLQLALKERLQMAGKLIYFYCIFIARLFCYFFHRFHFWRKANTLPVDITFVLKSAFN